MQPIQHISVIGAGAWGTALAKHLAEKGLQTILWAYERDVLESIASKRENQLFLPGVALPPSLRVTNTLAEALEQCDGLLFVVPSHVARQVLQQLAPLLSRPPPHHQCDQRRRRRYVQTDDASGDRGAAA